MFFVVGAGSRVKPSGAGRAICPACGRSVSLHACKKYTAITLFFVPILPFGSSYIATCPSCASVMELENSKGRELEKRGSGDISSSDLTVLQNNAGISCPDCHNRIAPGSNFCPHCGRSLL